MRKPYYSKSFRPGEQLVKACHPSMWAIRGSVFANMLLWCVPFFLLIPLLRLKALGTVTLGVIFFIASWWTVRLAVTWYFTALVVTDRRTIYFNQIGFFRRFVAEVPFRSLQDISYERRGLNAVLTDYGTVMIQSASSTQRLECTRIGHPDRVVDLIRQSQAAWLNSRHGDPAYDAMYPAAPFPSA